MTAFQNPSDYGADPHDERPRTPLAYYRSETTMVKCTCCNSGSIESNRVANKHPLDVATAVIESLKAGKSTHAAGEAALWAFKEIRNRMRAEWKCDHCGQVF